MRSFFACLLPSLLLLQTGHCGEKELSSAELAKKVRPSLVTVTQYGRAGVDGLGSGFVFDESGLIATNLHVIGEGRRLRVELADGRLLPVTEVHASDAQLDLAILKVKAKGLEPLPLGDSDLLEQGQSVVAMGNPEGLEFSVVDGVISALREIEEGGAPMLQMALPIERGNSGGPVLNRQGEVVGIVTLKSLRTDNLGFAMPVNSLKPMLEKPNPVPMSRWMTIGALDRKQWQVKMGASWSQRAGVIRVDTPGEGFGGRALCLSTEPVPEGAYEVSVMTRLEDESGAAGLVFASDGGQRHYGFYPSGGKLRLTRFEGPDVYSWTILKDVPVEGYRDEDWNRLRVRVEGPRIQCWVNEELVLEIEEDALQGDLVGLCKFRDTVAEFRHFRVGQDLAPKPVAPSVAREIDRVLELLVEDEVEPEKMIARLLDTSVEARRRLGERRRELEQEAALLRQLESGLHRQAVVRQLITELEKPEGRINLLKCALLLARYDNPQVSVPGYLERFEQWVQDLKREGPLPEDLPSFTARLNRFLFKENGFHGSRHDFGNRSNSYVNEVLDDREGLPITLSVIYLEMARAAGVPDLFGVGLPGRFMVGFLDEADGRLRLLDVFEGGKEVTLREFEEDWNGGFALDPSMRRPATKRSIVLRMIKNLLNTALESEEAGVESMPYLNLMLALEPASPPERFARARLRQLDGDAAGAREDVEWLMENSEEIPPGVRMQLEQWYHSLQQ